MFIKIQFPLVDLRAFLGIETGKLNIPFWPAPRPDKDFVRYFGPIKSRPKGGVRGWVGESEVCEADKLINFPKEQIKINGFFSLPFKTMSRQFFFDGMAVGKFEIGVDVDLACHTQTLGTNPIPIDTLIDNFLNTTYVEINHPSIKTANYRLADAGARIARAYEFSSTSTEHLKKSNIEDWWVQPARPVLSIQLDKENISDLFRFDSVQKFPRSSHPLDKAVWFHTYSSRGSTIPLWLIDEPGFNGLSMDLHNMGDKAREEYVDVRSFRIVLMRLHAEQECFRHILSLLASNRLEITPNTPSSNVLQSYLQSSTKKLKRMEGEPVVGDWAKRAQDLFTPGERDSILEALDNLNIRQNTYRNVTDLLNTHTSESMYNRGGITVTGSGDTFIQSGGQSGAFGPNATVYDNVFVQWQGTSKTHNLAELAKELHDLRNALKAKSELTDVDRDVVIGDIAKAEQAARKDDGPKAFEYLSQAGQWALETAKQIGVRVAAEAIQEAMRGPQA